MRRVWYVLIIVIFFLCAGGGWWYWNLNKIPVPEPEKFELQLDAVEKKHRIIIFVHGTFGSILGLLDIPSVMRDNLKGSLYTKTARSMRKDHFFFSTQPLLHRGLVAFEPSFDRREDQGFFAAYPIGKSFDVFSQKMAQADEVRHYYVFGWSGLLSQNKRRLEGLRLLNELNEEIKKFKDRGIDPKITIVCHSHGGNVLLNMGALVSQLRGEKLSQIPGVEDADSLQKQRIFLAALPDRQATTGFLKQKKWDYAPECPSWNIEHLALFGVPLQPETDFACKSSLFESVYNFYSYADRVQPSDWVSTSRYYSEQRFDRVEALYKKHQQKLPEKIVQARIMFGRKVSEDGDFVVAVDGVGSKKQRTAWNMLVGDLSAQQVHADPTHKEFWFLVFPKMGEECALKPIPVAACFPLLLNLLKKVPERVDCDVNMTLRENEFCLEVAEHNHGKVLAEERLPGSFIKEIQAAIKNWEVDSEFLAKEESLISSHLRAGREC